MANPVRPEFAMIIRVDIEEDESGLLIATSSDVSGLFVTGRSLDDLSREIPQVIKALLVAELEHEFEVWQARSREPSEKAWVAIPAHVASQAMQPSP